MRDFKQRMLPSSDMSAAPQFTTAAYGMAAVLAWGTSDFLGGYATRRANAFLFTVVVNLGGLLLVGTLASATHAPFPSARSAGLGAGWRHLRWRCPGHLLPRAFFGTNGIDRAGRCRLQRRNPGGLFHVEGCRERFPSSASSSRRLASGSSLAPKMEPSSKGIGLAVFAGIGFAGFYLASVRPAMFRPFGLQRSPEPAV